MDLLGTVPPDGGVPAAPTKAQHSLPFSPSSLSASQSSESPSKGSGKRKAQPRKRIIIDDDQGSVSFMEEMKASTSKEEIKKEESESMPSFPEDPVEILSRLHQFLGEAAMQQLLNGEVTPSGAPPLDASSLSALLSSSSNPSTPAPDGVHPMLQAAALSGLQSTPLGVLLSPSTTTAIARPPTKGDKKEETPVSPTTLSPLDCHALDAVLSVAMNASLTPAQNARTLTLKRKLFDNNKEAMRAAIASISQEERVDLDDLENFAQLFKKQRVKFGFTQGDVGMALGKRYGTDFSQTTISRFEALNLSFKNMCKLRPLLKEWLGEAELALANGATAADLLDRTPSIKQTTPVSGEEMNGMDMMYNGMNNGMKKRRKRTNLDTTQKAQLDEEFEVNPRPNHLRMSEIANMLDLDRDVVRVWFCNRRQKVRKLEDERLTFESASITAAHLNMKREEREEREDRTQSPSEISLSLPTPSDEPPEKKAKEEEEEEEEEVKELP